MASLAEDHAAVELHCRTGQWRGPGECTGLNAPAPLRQRVLAEWRYLLQALPLLPIQALQPRIAPVTYTLPKPAVELLEFRAGAGMNCEGDTRVKRLDLAAFHGHRQ